MVFRSWRLPPFLLLFFTLTACSSIPKIQFGSDEDASTANDAGDASTLADGDPFDSGTDAAPDGGGKVCPDKPPVGANACCKTVACVGNKQKCESECTNCFNNCKDQGVCCLDSNGNYKGCALLPTLCIL